MAYYRDVEDDIARGLISGSSVFGSFGKIVTSGPVTNRVIWPNGAYVIPPQAGFEPEIYSSSVDDTAAGTGIRTLEIHYVDTNYEEQVGSATLNGITPVSTYREDGTVVDDAVFIQCMHMVTYGTGKAAAGNIILREVGDTISYSYISTGSVRCASSARMVPANKRLIVRQAFASSTSTTADETSNISFVATRFEAHDYLNDSVFIPFMNLGFRNNSFGSEFVPPMTFPEKTVVALSVTSDKAAIISGSWNGFIENIPTSGA